jgi:hypothetical protein
VRPLLRRIDDVVPGEPVEIGSRVVTPHARRTGWVLQTQLGAVFRIATRPHSLAIQDVDGEPARVMPVRDRQRQLMFALWFVAFVLIAHMRRRRRSR